MSTPDRTQEKINAELRATHKKLPHKSSLEWLDHIKKKCNSDIPAQSEDRLYTGGGLLYNTYSEKRLAHVSLQAVNALVPDVTVTWDDPMAKNIGKLGVLCSDLHDDIFPCYLRARIVPLELMDDYAELNDASLVLYRNCAMSFAPDPAGVYGAGVKVFDFRQFKRDMAYLGRKVDLNELPPCPILHPEAFHTWMNTRELSKSSDTLFTETNDKTDTKDYYAAWSLYKSFKFHGGTTQNQHSDIGFAGCTWTLTRPTREEPSLVFSVCRFDPVAYFFPDRADIIDKYIDVRKKRAAGKDPVPVEPSTFAYTTGMQSGAQGPLGLSDESLDAAEARLKEAGVIGQASFKGAMDFESADEFDRAARSDAMKVMVNATMGDFLGDRDK